MTTRLIVKLLIRLKYIDYVKQDVLREYRRYQCRMDKKEFGYSSVTIHFSVCHRDVYERIVEMVEQRSMVVCGCGGHYKAGDNDGRKQHESTLLHKEWVVNEIRYSPFTTPKQTITTVTK